MSTLTIRIDATLRKQLDDYCSETGSKMSDALRHFIKDGLERHQQKNELGFVDSIGSQGLMVNEKRAIRAVIESLYIVRSLAKDQAVLDETTEKAKDVLREGWFYDNK
ncbi:MAG: hypothetical protein ABIH77_04780 [Pseudomonadota bacterium]|nr:hypothetical protein [Gammaproteobacteria bacterium]MBU1629024.1 hypothetical protein [Gammaproteobacteria bacterium]MBU2546733.1 hypothetical protein [Gammaproteobacteria bacterium]